MVKAAGGRIGNSRSLETNRHPGEISEVEDYVPITGPGSVRPSLAQHRYGSDFDCSDIGEGYRLSTASSYIGMPQAQMLSSNSIDSLDIDSFLKGVAQPHGVYDMPSYDSKLGQSLSVLDDNSTFPTLSEEEENDVFWMGGFTSGQMNMSNGRNEAPETNIWAQ